MRTVLVIAGLATACFQADPAKTELAKFQGEWKFVSVEADGQDVTEGLREAKILIKDDNFTLTLPAGDNKVLRGIKLGVTTTPRCIDFLGRDDKGKPDGKDIEGIYEWQKDRVRICVSTKDGIKERPLEFSAKSNSGRILLVMERKPTDDK